VLVATAVPTTAFDITTVTDVVEITVVAGGTLVPVMFIPATMVAGTVAAKFSVLLPIAVVPLVVRDTDGPQVPCKNTVPPLVFMRKCDAVPVLSAFVSCHVPARGLDPDAASPMKLDVSDDSMASGDALASASVVAAGFVPEKINSVGAAGVPVMAVEVTVRPLPTASITSSIALRTSVET